MVSHLRGFTFPTIERPVLDEGEPTFSLLITIAACEDLCPTLVAAEHNRYMVLVIAPMPRIALWWTVIVIVGLAVLGWACLFRTRILVEYARQRYERSNRFIKAWPGHGTVMKSWYPGYLRSMGIFVWSFDLLIIMVVFFPNALPRFSW
jgi:hypothetical protein